MLIAFICTLTFLPAAITLFRPGGEKGVVGFSWAVPLDPLVARWRRPILGFFAAVAVVSIAMAHGLTFDANPLDTSNQNTEAMRTLKMLMGSPITNPFTIDILEPNVQDAATLADRLRKLPSVSSVRTLASFVPADQDKKLAIIQDASAILGPTLTAPASAAPVTPDQIRLAAKAAYDQIAPALSSLKPGNPLQPIANDLKAIEFRAGRHRDGDQPVAHGLSAAGTERPDYLSGRRARDAGLHSGGAEAAMGAARRSGQVAGITEDGGQGYVRPRSPPS